MTEKYTDNHLIYVHVPFCMRLCGFCNYKAIRYTQELMDAYREALIREIPKSILYYRKRCPEIDQRKYDAILFGGGTPSLLDPDDMDRILSLFRKHLSVTNDAEITVESDPIYLDLERLKGFRRAGINRISLGVQSFSKKTISTLQRHNHSAEKCVESIRDARDAGFDHISIDIIYGVPGQTMREVMRDVERVLEFKPENITHFTLWYKEGTKLTKRVLEGKLAECRDSTLNKYFVESRKLILDQGYRQTDGCNYYLPGYECRHNKRMCSLNGRLAFGPSAMAFLPENRKSGRNARRLANEDNTRKYISLVKTKGVAIVQDQEQPMERIRDEYLMQGLIQNEGILKDHYKKRFGTDIQNDYGEVLSSMAKAGLIEVSENGVKPRDVLYEWNIVDSLIEGLGLDFEYRIR